MGRNSLDVDYLYENRFTNPLLQTDVDFCMFGKIYDIIKKNRFTYITVLSSIKCKSEFEWICMKTPVLDDSAFEYKLGTRLVWIFLGLMDFPRCGRPSCEKKIGIRSNVTFNRSYSRHCSNRCLGKDPDTIAKKENTNMAKRGVRYPTQDPEIKKRVVYILNESGTVVRNRVSSKERVEKTKRTKRRHREEDPDYQNKINAKTRATKKKQGKPETWNNREQAARTYREKTGFDWPTQNPEVMDKRKADSMRKYGYEYPIQSPEVQEKRVKTYRENHDGVGSSGALREVIEKKADTYEKKTGYRNPLSDPSVRRRIDDVNLDRYGDIFPSRTKPVKEKAENTRVRRYGIKCVPSGKFRYCGIRFDSEAELSYWIYKSELGADIRKCAEADRLEFEFEGKTYGYYCDFMVDGRLVEIKGDQFFRLDGTMYCPYRYKRWTDEEYKSKCDLYEAKHQCMIRNGVTILLYSGDVVQSALKYVREKYGKDYLSKFRISRNRGIIKP